MNARRGGWGKRSSRVLRSPVVKGRDCFRQTLSHMEYIMSRQSVWVCFVILLGNRDTEFICFCHRKAGICFTYWLLITLKNSLLNPRHFHCLLTVLKWWQIPEAWGFSFLFECAEAQRYSIRLVSNPTGSTEERLVFGRNTYSLTALAHRSDGLAPFTPSIRAIGERIPCEK